MKDDLLVLLQLRNNRQRATAYNHMAWHGKIIGRNSQDSPSSREFLIRDETLGCEKYDFPRTIISLPPAYI